MATKDAVRAAQPADGTPKVPTPKAPQQHLWNTPDEYVAQLALPVHFVADGLSVAGPGLDIIPGSPYYTTLCGERIGGSILRTTDDVADLTCAKCKRKRGPAKTTTRRAQKK